MDMRQLPVVIRRQVPTAPLPQNYRDACLAIRECSKIDQVAEWTNRAKALATYAREANDMTLITDAQKIQVRAETRVGELLLEMYPNKTKTERALVSGFSRSRVVTAETLAEIPSDQLENVMNSRAHTKENFTRRAGYFAGITPHSVAHAWEQRPDGPKQQEYKERRERDAKAFSERTEDEINRYAFHAAKEAITGASDDLDFEDGVSGSLCGVYEKYSWGQGILGATDLEDCDKLEHGLTDIIEKANVLLKLVRGRSKALRSLKSDKVVK